MKLFFRYQLLATEDTKCFHLNANLSWIFFPLLTKTSTWSTSTWSSPWGGTCRGSSCHSQRTPGVRPPSRCLPSPPWSSYTDRPAVLFDHILIALALSSLIIYWSSARLFDWLLLPPQASTPPSSGSRAPSCSKSCSACSTLITKTVRLRHIRSRRSGPCWAAFRLLVSFWRFLVFQDRFMVSLCSLPCFYMNSNLAWD